MALTRAARHPRHGGAASSERRSARAARRETHDADRAAGAAFALPAARHARLADPHAAADRGGPRRRGHDVAVADAQCGRHAAGARHGHVLAATAAARAIAGFLHKKLRRHWRKATPAVQAAQLSGASTAAVRRGGVRHRRDDRERHRQRGLQLMVLVLQLDVATNVPAGMSLCAASLGDVPERRVSSECDGAAPRRRTTPMQAARRGCGRNERVEQSDDGMRRNRRARAPQPRGGARGGGYRTFTVFLARARTLTTTRGANGDD